MFIEALFTNNQDIEMIQLSIDIWIGKENNVYMQVKEYWSTFKMKKFLMFVIGWMDLEDIKLSEKTCLKNDNSWLHMYEVSKVVKFIVVENTMAIAKTEGGRNELFNGHKLSVILGEKILVICFAT